MLTIPPRLMQSRTYILGLKQIISSANELSIPSKILNSVGMALINGVGGYFSGALLALSKSVNADDFCIDTNHDNAIIAINAGVIAMATLPIMQVLLTSRFDGTSKVSSFFLLSNPAPANHTATNLTGAWKTFTDRTRFFLYGFQPFIACLVGGFILRNEICNRIQTEKSLFALADSNLLIGLVGGLVFNLSASAVDTVAEVVYAKFEVSDKIHSVCNYLGNKYENWGNP